MPDPDRRSGVLLHPTSLPGPHGSGDLGPAAHAFVDWLASAGQRLWQLLPLGPPGFGNSPYQARSAFAGNPQLVALQPLVDRGWLALPAVLPSGAGTVDWPLAVPWRLAQLQAACDGFDRHASASDRTAFAGWCARHAGWLDDYALFSALHAAQGDQPWWTWPPALRDRDRAALRRAAADQAHAAHVCCFVQWCFDWQLGALRDHAAACGIALVGDLPIFVAHDSADCWTRPDLFHLDAGGRPTVVAGVPPDALGPDGQRWGNPLYRWDRMAADGFAWWVARLQRALQHCALVRIDHFRGFAAYWEIAADSPGAKAGRWVDAPGQALFTALQAALGPLPVIAEDLGLITPDVRALRDAFDLPGMKVLQFAFNGDGDHEFLPHNYASRRCVVITGSHDNDTVRSWWRQAPAATRRFAATYLGCSDSVDADVHWPLIRAACQSVADTAVFPLQDLLGGDNTMRMNWPGSVGGANWGWRFAWPQLTPDIAPRLRALCQVSGRC